MWYSTADTQLKLQDRVVGGARFLTGGVCQCGISHRRSVAALFMLYKICCNQVHPFNGAVPGPYAPVLVSCGAMGAHQYSYVPPRCRTSQYRRNVILLSVSLWNNFANPVFVGVGLAGFKSRTYAFLFA